jgi:hypothetical protein
MSTNQTFKSIDEVSQERFKYTSCTEAALSGDLNELKKMHEAGFEWDLYTPALATANGHLECLKYVHENGCEWNLYSTAYAAEKGYLQCLKYAHENGCEWNLYIPAFASKNDHLECLKYAHENGCQWNEDTPTYGARFGHVKCFKYCFEMWNDPQEFWKYEYDLVKIIDKIDLDDPVWRRLFSLDLKKYPQLESKVESKKKELEEIKQASKEALLNILPTDIIKFILQPYF